jgi:hypothetical protein
MMQRVVSTILESTKLSPGNEIECRIDILPVITTIGNGEGGLANSSFASCRVSCVQCVFVFVFVCRVLRSALARCNRT